MTTWKTSQMVQSRGRESGFSVLELIIGLAVVVEVLVVVLIIFDVNTRLTRVQTQITEMQQSQRVAQHDLVRTARMAGRGGLPQVFAVETRQGVAAATKISTAANAPTVVEDTDILIVRGVFSSPIYQIDYVEPGTVVFNPGPQTGTLIVTSLSPTGIPQSLDVLEDLAQGGPPPPEALILVSPIDDSIYAVVEIDTVAVVEIGDLDGDGTNEKQATVNFNFNPATGDHTADYLALSLGGVFPAALNDVAYAGVVEEYRYFIEAGLSIPGDVQSGVVPKLARARMFPGTETLYDANASVEIADNIVDLQVALGIDRDANGQIDNNADPSADEWLYNASGDDELDAGWGPVFDGAGNVTGFTERLFYVRLNVLARTARPEVNFTSPPILAIEDRDYSEPQLPSGEQARQERMFRRRLSQTVVDMRNVG